MSSRTLQAVTTPASDAATGAPRPSEASRPYGDTLRGYLRREIAFPTAFTLLGLSALMLARQMLGFSDLIVNKGLGAGTVAQMALLQFVPLISEVLPLAVLVGSLVALGRLAADQEIIAIEACGLASRRLTYPVATFGVGATLVGGLLSAALAPAALRQLDATLEDIVRTRPGTAVHAGEPARFGNWRLQAREVSSSGTELKGVVIEVPDLDETIFAESGALEAMPGGATRLLLRDGIFVSVSRGDPWKLRFEQVATQLPGGDDASKRSSARERDALPLAELWAEAAGAGSAEASRASVTEIQRRLSRPFAAFVFSLLATPLFLARGGRSRSGGGLLGIISVLVYYGLVQLGTGLDKNGMLPAGLGLWLPNLALLTLALVLHRAVADRSPIARRERRSSVDPLSRLRELGRGLKATRGASDPGPPAPATGRPSRHIRTRSLALQRYVATSFLKQLALSFAVLLAAYLIVDVLERLQWFARFNATASEAIRFYGLRVPLLISRIVPMALLVATALLVSLMGVRGELTAMRASGVPAPRGMLPALALCALVAPLSFLLNDQIVPRANFLNEVLKSTEIKAEERWYSPNPSAPGRKAVWLLEGNRLVEAERLDPQLGIVQGLTIYDLDERGLPLVRRDARAGRHLGGGTWRLVDPQRIEIGTGGLVKLEGASFAALWETVPVENDTRNLSVAELREEIRLAGEHGYDSTAMRVDLAGKLAAPFACLVLPAVVFLYSLGGPPYPKTASALVVSVGIGIGSVLLNDLAASLGYGGAIPPGIAGWAPNAFFGLLACYLGIRVFRRA